MYLKVGVQDSEDLANSEVKKMRQTLNLPGDSNKKLVGADLMVNS